ncbi:hypothetical protein ACFYO1_03025 [Nocardia sp. NPDC006044]|uniref:hypothetical protein n=1 Tax=Nocardia sp. NPDC006044 TaxID=3364306 RepID=UPI00368908B5
MSDDPQMMIDLGDVDLTPIHRQVPPGPPEWVRWFSQMDAQLAKFATETIPALPQPIWSDEAIERVAEVFDGLFPDIETVDDPANAEIVDQFIRWLGECYTHYSDETWWYSTYGPALYDPDEPNKDGPTTVRFWLLYAAEYGFAYIRDHFRPQEEADGVDDEYRRREQARIQAAAAAFRRFHNAPDGLSGHAGWDAWIAPHHQARQVQAFLDHIGWPALPPEPWDDADPDVARIGGLLTDWFPNRKAMVAADNADRADQVVCFLGECLLRYAGARWFDRRQYEDMFVTYMGEKKILSLYDGFEPAVVAWRSGDHPDEMPFYTYAAGELLPRAVKNFADMTRFVQGLAKTSTRIE